MPIGTVKFFDNAKGYGFITNEAGGNDAFVHISAVEAAGMSTLEKEQRLSYELENGKGGKSSAVNLHSAYPRLLFLRSQSGRVPGASSLFFCLRVRKGSFVGRPLSPLSSG